MFSAMHNKTTKHLKFHTFFYTLNSQDSKKKTLERKKVILKKNVGFRIY